MNYLNTSRENISVYSDINQEDDSVSAWSIFRNTFI